MITQLLDKATTMKLLVSHHSVPNVQARGRAVATWLERNLGPSKPRTECTEKFAYGNTVSKLPLGNDLPRPQHLPNTLTNNCSLRYTFLYYTDPVTADDGSRKHSATVERRPGGKSEVNDVIVRGVSGIGAGER